MRKRLLGLLALVAVIVALLPMMSAFAGGGHDDPACYENQTFYRYEKQIKKGQDWQRADESLQFMGPDEWVDHPVDITNRPSGPWVLEDSKKIGNDWYRYVEFTKVEEVEVSCPITVPDMCPVGLTVVKATNLDHNGWTIGDATFVSGGIEIAVPGGWEEVSISRPFNKTLKELGDVLGIDAAPLQYVGLHFHTSEGVIVYEEEASYNGNLWSTADFGVGSGMGYASFAPLEAYVAANPDLVVTQVDVLYTHPDPSSTVVASVTFGCQKFIFDFEAQETTTTTTPEETTTTVEETTTTTVEETTTTTVEDSTTSTTSPTTPPTTEGSLPFTGIGDFYLPTAIAMVAAGGLLLALSRRPEEDVA